MRSELWNIPNLLSLSRLPLAILVCWGISAGLWWPALGTFVLATLTDWLDGWWARRFACQSAVGRTLDPLTDKVLIASVFLFLIPVTSSQVAPWMVAVVVGRELLITGLRGLIESSGQSFGADWFGKLKTVLQCTVLIAILLLQTLQAGPLFATVHVSLDWFITGLLATMLFATIGSAVQYFYKAYKVLTHSDGVGSETPLAGVISNTNTRPAPPLPPSGTNH